MQGTHTLRVRATGFKNAASSGYNVPADRVDIVSGGSTVGQGIHRIVNVYTGLDLEVNGASFSNGGTVDQWSDLAGANNERWNLMAVGDASYRIINVNSGLDLEDNGWGTANGSIADQWQDNGAGSAFGKCYRSCERVSAESYGFALPAPFSLFRISRNFYSSPSDQCVISRAS